LQRICRPAILPVFIKTSLQHCSYHCRHDNGAARPAKALTAEDAERRTDTLPT
jgi:cell division protein FtsB